MGYQLHIDDEQADLLRISAAMMASALEVRAKRIDPDKVVSASARVQQSKLQNVLQQLDQPRLMQHGELPPNYRIHLHESIDHFLSATTDHEKELHFSNIRAVCLLRLGHPDLPWDPRQGRPSSVRPSPMEGAPEADEA